MENGNKFPNENWYSDQFGFREQEYEETQDCLEVLTDPTNGKPLLEAVPPDEEGVLIEQSRQFFLGDFETLTLGELRSRLLAPNSSRGLTFRLSVGDVAALHRENPDAVFQVASLATCLVSEDPDITPEHGITRICKTRAQGNACALVCPVGTAYRNYLVGESQEGQGGTNGVQLDLMDEVGRYLGNNAADEDEELGVSARLGQAFGGVLGAFGALFGPSVAGFFGGAEQQQPVYWNMRNGYLKPVSADSFKALAAKMRSDEFDVDAALALVKVGAHWETSVAAADYTGTLHNVTQVYCSALPMSFNEDLGIGNDDWEPLARLCLDGLYEATLAVAAIVSQQRGGERVKVFLTMVGGGAFENPKEWILAAIKRALKLFEDHPLDVELVHFGELDVDIVNNLLSYK